MSKYKLISLVLVILGLCMLVYANKPYKNTDEYLKRNYADLNLNDEDDLSGFEILEKDLKGKKVILAGEYHNLDKNEKLQINFLKYLQKEVNVNYILEEGGYADAYFLNKYLESGNEEILKNYFNVYKGQKLYTKERYNYFIEVYKLNQTLPKDEQIKVVGADVESQATYEYLTDVMKENTSITNELKELIGKLKDFDYSSKGSYIDIIDILEKVNKDIKDNEEAYKNILKEDEEFDGFKLAISNLIDFTDCAIADINDKYNLRDKYIYENFKLIDSKLQDAIYFGQWGADHTLQDTVYHGDFSKDIHYFASLLKKDLEYKDKILSIEYSYYSTQNQKIGGYYHINEDLFKNYLTSNSDVSIFKLNNRKSPLKNEYINTFNTDVIDYKNNPTTNYFQYLVLIRNSKPSAIVFE
ncbi:MAG: hypothetical protein ACRCXT_02505 [Paraclostridium sp.]